MQWTKNGTEQLPMGCQTQLYIYIRTTAPKALKHHRRLGRKIAAG